MLNSTTPHQLENGSSELDAIIRPLRDPAYEVDTFWHMIDRQLDGMTEYGVLEMCPDYQRGHVWTEAQQIAYIEATMRGTLPTSGRLLQFNCPNWDFEPHDEALPPGVQCMDGLQRYTAARRFMAGEIQPFGLPLQAFEGTAYDPKRYRFRLAVYCFKTRREVLQHYLDINDGGTPHHESEISRVRQLLAAVQP